MEDNKQITPLLSFDFSAQLPLMDIQPIVGRKWVLNGEDNFNFKMYRDAYHDSVTNHAIINSYTNYTYGDGLRDRNGIAVIDEEGNDVTNTRITNVTKHMSKKDVRLCTLSYKEYGAFAMQVIWNSTEDKSLKKPIVVKYISVAKLGLNINDRYEVDGYWYSFDWAQKSKYKPILYPKFDGNYKDADVEIIVFNTPGEDDFFAKPDWFPALRYAQLEGELATSSYSHVINGFQGAKMLNLNNGIPATEELKQQYKQEIDRNLKGTRNTNKFFVTFNTSKENAAEIIDLGVAQLNDQYVYFSEECERKVIAAHAAPTVLYSSLKGGSGLGNNADEIEMATARLYRDSVNPNREVILDGFSFVFKFIDPSIKLYFQDFPTFKGDKREEVAK